MKKIICLFLCVLMFWNTLKPVHGAEAGEDTGTGTETQTDTGTDTGTGDSTDTGTGDSTDTGTGDGTDTGTGDGTDTDSGDGGDSEEPAPDPIPLTAPSRAGWGRDYRFLLEFYRKQDPERIKTDDMGREYVDCPGMMYWSADDDHQRRYRLDLYRQDPESGNVLIETIEEWKVLPDSVMESSFHFLWTVRLSGDYYFAVRALGDGTEYADSETTQSPVWTYEAPEKQLTQPTRPRWKGTSESSTAFIYPPATDDGPDPYTGLTGEATTDNMFRMGYEARWWYVAALNNETEETVVRDGEEEAETGESADSGDATDSTTPREAGTILTFYPKHYEFTPSEKMLADFGSGYYSVQIRALSKDVAQAKPSDWSPLSMVRYIASEDTDLMTIVGRVDKNTDAVNRQLAINNVRKFGTYKLLELMSADKNNTGAVAAIEQLENITGNFAQIVVSGGLDEIFPEQSISVIGAGLNVDLGQTAVFHLGAAHADEVPSSLYSHAVRFSMQLLDTNDASLTSDGKDLAVPVKITLPVPDTINPSFFTVLHHRMDDTVETIPYQTLRKVENKWYASFIVTNFSDFTLAEQAVFLDAKRTADGVSVSYRMNHAPDVKTAFCALRDSAGRLCALRTLTPSESQQSATIPCEGTAANAQVFLLDANARPLVASLTVPVTG